MSALVLQHSDEVIRAAQAYSELLEHPARPVLWMAAHGLSPRDACEALALANSFRIVRRAF